MNAATKALQNVKKKVVGVTSDVLSAPKRAYYGVKSQQANRDYDALTRARKFDTAPSFSASGAPSAALMARTAADEVRQRRSRK